MKKIIMVTLLGLAIAGCGSSTSGSPSSGGGGTTPSTSSTINLGTISTIPIGIGESAMSDINTNTFTQSSNKPIKNKISVKTDTQGNSGSITYITIVNNSSKTANLTNIKVTGDSSVEKNPSWYIDTSSCSKVIAQGTCNIKINPPAANGSFVLTVNYDIGSYSQMVSYEKGIPAADGFIYKINNNLIVTKSVAERSAFSIPVVLSQDMSSLKVQSNRPGFVNTQIVCNGGTSGQNNLCTIMGVVQPGTPAGVASVGLSGISAKSGETISMTLPLMVVNQNAANLVTTGANVVINPLIANESTQTVTILNNGNATATGITFSANNPAIQLGGASSCTSLSAGSSCDVTVTSSESQNFQGTVIVNFSGGVVASTSFSVAYIASALSPGLTFVTGGNLLYTVLGESSNYSINVQNTGAAPLFNLNPLNINGVKAQLSYSTTGISSPCALNGSQALAIGQNCILQIQYTPISVESGSFNYTVTSSYLDNLGESLSYMPGTIPVQYSSIGSPANLSSNPTTWAFAIRADGRESMIESFAISNSGKISTTLDSITVPSPLSLVTGANNCIQGTILQAESANTCNIYVKYGPRTVNESNSISLSIGYVPKPGESDTTLNVPITYSASTAALIDVVSITSSVNGASESVSGTGSSGSPYTFYNTPTNQLTTTITYKNVGTESAQFFNLNLYNIQNVVAVSSASTCGTGAATTSLAVGSSCTLILNTVNTNIYTQTD